MIAVVHKLITSTILGVDCSNRKNMSLDVTSTPVIVLASNNKDRLLVIFPISVEL